MEFKSGTQFLSSMIKVPCEHDYSYFQLKLQNTIKTLKFLKKCSKTKTKITIKKKQNKTKQTETKTKNIFKQNFKADNNITSEKEDLIIYI